MTITMPFASDHSAGALTCEACAVCGLNQPLSNLVCQ